MENFFEHSLHISAIVLACYVAPGQGSPLHPDRPSYGLALNVAGEKLYCFEDGRHLKVGQNDIILLPKRSSYVVKEAQTGGCYAINFQLQEEMPLAPFVMRLKDYGSVLAMFKGAEKAFRLKRFDYEMRCMAELYSIICALHRERDRGYASGRNRALILPALDYIHSEYTGGNISIEYLAGLCGIKPAYFRRVFASCLGAPPIKYINRLKLDRARELLASGLYSVTAAMELSGFNDPCYFSRLFRHETGMSPSEYRNGGESTPPPLL